MMGYQLVDKGIKPSGVSFHQSKRPPRPLGNRDHHDSGEGDPDQGSAIVINKVVCGRSEGGRRWLGVRSSSFGRIKMPHPCLEIKIGVIK